MSNFDAQTEAQKRDRPSPYFRGLERLPGSKLASPAKPGDVGHDLFCVVMRHDQTILDRLLSLILGKSVIIIMPLVGHRLMRTGVHLCMGRDYWCEIRARSSTSRKKIQVLGGTIDAGYSGELYVDMHNFGFLPRLIQDGERYAQVVFFEAVRPLIHYIRDPELFQSVVEERARVWGVSSRDDRGASGFGSTGR